MKQKVFRLLADLRFSIFILLIISLFSILGTVIEQDQSLESYKLNYPITNPVFGILSWDKIIYFGLDHVYTTWWFLSLIFLTTSSFSRLKLSTILNKFSFNTILFRMHEEQYSIFHQKNMIYCYKGLIGRIAPIIVHFSMILVLIGTVVGALFGFKAQEIVPKTENFHIQNIIGTGPSSIIPNTATRVNDFWITYTKTKTISQFYSHISILNKQGTEITRKTVSVNYPLVHKGIYYYQTDWNLIGLRFQNYLNEIIEYPLINSFGNQNKVWLTWIANETISPEGIIIIVNNLEGYCSLYNNLGQFLGNLEINETLQLQLPITFLEILSSTGLQIKTDPGIPILYLGFFFLMVSTLISYITYSQIWIIRQNRQIFLGGTTNRASFDFELEFFKFIKAK